MISHLDQVFLFRYDFSSRRAKDDIAGGRVPLEDPHHPRFDAVLLDGRITSQIWILSWVLHQFASIPTFMLLWRGKKKAV